MPVDGSLQNEIGGTEIGCDLDLYPSEETKIKEVVSTLAAKIGTHMTAEAWCNEITERFAEAGFEVDMILGVGEEGAEKVWLPKVRIIGRTEPTGPTDYDRYGHEVRQQAGLSAPLVDTGRKSGLWTPGH